MPPFSAAEEDLHIVEYGDTRCSTSSIKPLAPLARRSVSFAATPDVKATIHINDYTPEEIHATWYNGNEYKLIKTANKETLSLMNRGGHLNIVEQCSRGLEFKTNEGWQRRTMIQMVAMLDVLDEQDFQLQEDGEIDAEALARIYMTHSAPCAAAAYNVGIKDQIAGWEPIPEANTPTQVSTTRCKKGNASYKKNHQQSPMRRICRAA